MNVILHEDVVEECKDFATVNTKEANAFYQSLGYEKENGYFKKL